MAGLLVPDNSRLALVGDPDGGDVGNSDPALLQGATDHALGALPDLIGVMLHPTRLGEDLLVLALVEADHAARVVEDHAARAGGALVDRGDILGHERDSFV